MGDKASSVLARLKNKAKEVEGIYKKIDVGMDEFPVILQSVNEFLCEPYTALIKGETFEKYWNADRRTWN